MLASSGAVYVYQQGFENLSQQDLNGDGHLDLFMQASPENWGIWYMQDRVRISGKNGSEIPNGGNVQAVGNLLGDSKPELVYVSASRDVVIQPLNANAEFVSTPIVLAPLPLGQTIRGCGDFNGDGHQDLILQDDAGTLQAWLLVNGMKTAEVAFPSNPVDPLWRLATIEDFNQDGFDDFVFQHRDGRFALWYMENLNPIGYFVFPDTYDAVGTVQLKIVASGDADLDGHTDLYLQHWDGRLFVWHLQYQAPNTQLVLDRLPLQHDLVGNPIWSIRNSGSQQRTPRFDWNNEGWADLLFQGSNGQLVIWQLVEDSFWFQRILDENAPGSDWKVMGHSDVDGDGHEDIIWQRDNGELLIWRMVEWTKLGELSPSHNASAPWRIAAIADFNKDGLDDWVFQHQINGRIIVWHMNGSQRDSWAWIDSVGNPAVKVEAASDMNSDGEPDLILRDGNQVRVWLMNEEAIITVEDVQTAVSSVWKLASVHDMNHDGFADFVFRNQNDGRIYAWYMQETALLEHGLIDTVGLAWEIRHSGD